MYKRQTAYRAEEIVASVQRVQLLDDEVMTPGDAGQQWVIQLGQNGVGDLAASGLPPNVVPWVPGWKT